MQGKGIYWINTGYLYIDTFIDKDSRAIKATETATKTELYGIKTQFTDSSGTGSAGSNRRTLGGYPVQGLSLAAF